MRNLRTAEDPCAAHQRPLMRTFGPLGISKAANFVRLKGFRTSDPQIGLPQTKINGSDCNFLFDNGKQGENLSITVQDRIGCLALVSALGFCVP